MIKPAAILAKKQAFIANKKKHGSNPIVPSGNMSSTTLVVVVAIMTFLASLALGCVNLINQSASTWQSQVSREATIQLKPIDGQDINKALNDALTLVKNFRSVKDAYIVDKQATERLLEPWLGSGLELADLPIPRLIVVTLDQNVQPNFQLMADTIQNNIQGAYFDSHRTWVNRLGNMAYTSVFIGFVILILVFLALTLTVVFATRSALSSNTHIVDVLHFIGATSYFVARQFDFHFLRIAFKGANYGGGAAIAIFLIFSFWSARNMATPQADQAAVLFGHFSIEWITYGQIILLILFVSFLTMLTSRLTVIRQLKEIDRRESDLF